jgi:hypothetical protein
MVLIAAVFALAGASFVFAHTQDYGGGDDQIEGHDHADQLWGGAGCDTMNLHGSSDLGYGGDNGCDDVRGMGGADDVVSVWEDNYGNDFVGGGDGNSDHCYAGAQDGWDFWTCEALN